MGIIQFRISSVGISNPLNKIIMKFAVALLLAFVATSEAFYYSPYFNAYSVGAPVAVAGGVQCHPQRCQACRESFEEHIPTYDCEGKCGLCALCQNTPNVVPDCQRWCTVGEAACTDNCNKGKAICTACAGACGLY